MTRSLRSLGSLTVVALGLALVSAACSSSDPVSSGSQATSRLALNASGPCADPGAAVWADSVVADDRADFDCADTLASGGDAGALLGAPDGAFTSLGPTAGNSVTVDFDTLFYDGDGADLVVYSVAMGDTSNGYYNVYVGDSLSGAFALVDSVRHQGTECIDLDGTGVTHGRYVRIVQAFDDVAFTPEAPCTTWGADIDAVGAMHLEPPCPTVDEACAQVGAAVDDMVPPDAEYANHGAYVSRVAHAATQLLQSDTKCFTAEQIETIHGCIVSQRAQSDVGKP